MTKMVNCWWLEGVMETATLSMTVLGICTCHHRCSVDTGVYVHVFKSEIINWVGKESEVFLNKSFKLMRNSFSRVCFVNQETKTIDKDLITLCRSIHYHQGTTWLVLFQKQLLSIFKIITSIYGKSWGKVDMVASSWLETWLF